MGCVQSACDFDVCLKANVLRHTNYTVSNNDDDGSDASSRSIGIDSFRLMPYLGLGGSGVVRAAKKLGGHDHGQVYALKCISKHMLLQKRQPQTAILELKLLAVLDNSPFICRCHYAFQDEHKLYMALDLAVGGDLKHNMHNSRDGRLSEQCCKFFIAQVLLALEACHEVSILHRDIKPENILMKASGYVYLTDFGVSKILSDIQDCRSTSGTHGYMAPEIYIEPFHKHGPPSEWFSVGVTLHELAVGRRPFPNNALKSIRDLKHEPPIDLSRLWDTQSISNTCKDFIQRLLVVNPSGRLGSSDGLSEIRSHPWLQDFDWRSLMLQKLPPPITPDLSYRKFDLEANQTVLALHNQKPEISPYDQVKFCNFHFRDRVYSDVVKPEVHRAHTKTQWTKAYEIDSSFRHHTLASEPSCIGSPSGKSPLCILTPRNQNAWAGLDSRTRKTFISNLSVEIMDKDEEEYAEIRRMLPRRPKSKSSSPYNFETSAADLRLHTTEHKTEQHEYDSRVYNSSSSALSDRSDSSVSSLKKTFPIMNEALSPISPAA